jgi:hypothetical protein
MLVSSKFIPRLQLIHIIQAALAEEDYKELPNTALGAFSNVLGSQALPVGRGFSPKSTKVGFSIATIIPQVIKGQVDVSFLTIG